MGHCLAEALKQELAVKILQENKKGLQDIKTDGYNRMKVVIVQEVNSKLASLSQDLRKKII